MTFLHDQSLQLIGKYNDGYYDLVASGGAARLRIHFARLGAWHAINLIWQHGGFTSSDPAAEDPSRPPFDRRWGKPAEPT